MGKNARAAQPSTLSCPSYRVKQPADRWECDFKDEASSHRTQRNKRPAALTACRNQSKERAKGLEPSTSSLGSVERRAAAWVDPYRPHQLFRQPGASDGLNRL